MQGIGFQQYTKESSSLEVDRTYIKRITTADFLKKNFFKLSTYSAYTGLAISLSTRIIFPQVSLLILGAFASISAISWIASQIFQHQEHNLIRERLKKYYNTTFPNFNKESFFVFTPAAAAFYKERNFSSKNYSIGLKGSCQHISSFFLEIIKNYVVHCCFKDYSYLPLSVCNPYENFKNTLAECAYREYEKKNRSEQILSLKDYKTKFFKVLTDVKQLKVNASLEDVVIRLSEVESICAEVKNQLSPYQRGFLKKFQKPKSCIMFSLNIIANAV